ncbi:hypothetical protein ILUMI_26679 [Ignelater luminosus]|uniref:HAT C-terminal dimerisation domain-containing protein n=1 Tax=Ignelater luminosus TaxID=2038154 RepID=A0A8K0C5G7_IGNLU|nr:hypothetical protein ILUMI_26679 [Ignelater luminosus]
MLLQNSKVLLSEPATSAASEHNWSAFSNIKTKKRNKLTVDRTHKLVPIKFNLEIFKGTDIDARYNELRENLDVQHEQMDVDGIIDEEQTTTDEDILYNEISSTNTDDNYEYSDFEDSPVEDTDTKEKQPEDLGRNRSKHTIKDYFRVNQFNSATKQKKCRRKVSKRNRC